MNIYVIFSIIAALICWLLVFFICSRSKGNPIRTSFAIVTGLIGIWTLFPFVSNLPGTDARILLLVRIIYVPAIFVPATFFSFMFYVLDLNQDEKARIILKTSYIISLGLFVLAFSPLFIRGVIRSMPDFAIIPGSGYIIFVLYFGFTYSYASLKLIQKYKKSVGYFRTQLKYVGLAFAIAFISGSIHFLSAYDVKEIFPHDILVVTYSLIMTYAIVKYRLMDINIAITRVAIFTVVYTLVLGIPFGLATASRQWLMTLFGEWWFWVPMLILLGLATIGPYFYLYLKSRAERLMLKEQHLYQNALRELSKSMTRIRNLDELINEVVMTVVDKVKVEFAAVYLKDEEYQSYRLKHSHPQRYQPCFKDAITQDNTLITHLCEQKKPVLSEEIEHLDEINPDASLAVPCFVEDDLLAFVVLGAKPEGGMYTPDDLFIFEALSYSMALAIENCFFWEEIHKKQREERIKEMDIYSYSLAHEIDNPVQVIIGSMETLKIQLDNAVTDQDQLEEIKSGIAYVDEAAMRVSDMVKAIEDFGKPVTGELSPLKIIDVINSFGRLYFPQFKSHGVRLIQEIPPEIDAFFVRGEKPELMQVLVILANNALHAMKYSKEKEVTLKVSLSNHNLIKLSLTDTGYGIKKEMVSILFTAFTTSKASSEGTGMGLYNAKKIVQRHKGKIWAESEGEGKGASFFVELPIVKDVKEEELKKTKRGKSVF